VRYCTASLGRVLVLRLEEGESIYTSVEEVCAREGVASAFVLAIGGMRRGKVVTGPEQPSGPIVPHYEEFDDARELVGVGTVFPQEGKPSLHFHAGIGRGDRALVGCPRAGMSVFLLLEVIVVELLGAAAERALDEESGLKLLRVLGKRG